MRARGYALAAVVALAACGESAPTQTAKPAEAPPPAPAPAPARTSVPLPDEPPPNFSVRLQFGTLHSGSADSTFVRLIPDGQGGFVYRRGRLSIAPNPADNERVVDREVAVTPEQLAAVYGAVLTSGLFDLEDTYANANAIDTRAPLITVVAGEYEKTVRSSLDADPAITRIREALDAL